MSRRRRRANDFTDSLNSYRCTDIDTDSLCSISQYSSDEVKSTSTGLNDTTHDTKHSNVLADSSLKHSFIQNSSISFTSTLEVHPVPDLNKRIDLFQVEQSAIKVSDKENNNPQNSIKENVSTKLSSTIKEQTADSRTKLKPTTMSENSRRDSNYNINNNEINASSILEQSASNTTVISQVAPSINCIDKGKQTSKNCEKKDANNETQKFETILCSLDNQLNQMKEVSHTQQVLKRLSDKFVHSPRNFTERLLTIIEESIMNNDVDRNETSAIDLSRLTTEFRKMCKFIEDESVPEWPPSPISTPPCPQRVSISPACNRSDHIKNLKNDKLCSPINASTSTTPISGVDIIRKRFFAKISKNNFNGNIDSVINESGNASFEHLEAQCNRLFPKEKEYSEPLLRSLSMPSLLSMSQIHNICEQQMASLNVSNDENHKENTILSTPNLLDKYIYQSPIISKPEQSFSKLNELHNKSKDNQYNNISYSKKKSRKMNEKFDNLTPDKLTNSYAMLDPDDLQKTLFEDIAKKRKRCLDTARLITEINADPEVIEAQKTLRMSPLFTVDNESNSLDDETKFLQTLVSCKGYQTYLEKQKPLFKLLQSSSSCATETSCKKTEKPDEECARSTVSKKEISNIKKSPSRRKCNLLSPNVKSSNQYTSPLTKRQDNEKEGKKENVRPKLFITPGKSPSNKDHKKTKVYFPNMHSPKQTKVRHILKSPHAEGLYRLNYNTVISPVGMYIRGTDMQLIKNVRAKTDNLLLTPLKRNVKVSLNKNLKEENTPPKCINKSQEKTPLKINLSPKVNVYKQEAYKNLLESNNMPKNNFVLPKVSYKLPLQIKTIKENESPKQGPRMKKLLEVAQSKIVIRHQGRINSVQKGKSVANDVYEINYEPEDESIHIEQAANKTNFIHKWKNI